MFRDIIPVEALGEEDGLKRGRGRQGLLPDFRLELPSPAREPELRDVTLVMFTWPGGRKEWREDLLFSLRNTGSSCLNLTKITTTLQLA